MELKTAEKSDYKFIKKLYFSAFPKEERVPYIIIKKKIRQSKGEMLVAKDAATLCGFAYMLSFGNLSYIFYLAVDSNMRGKGIGSEILRLIKEKYDGKKIFLARETLDKTAENYQERIKRHKFYQKNGFVDLSSQIKEARVTYDVMSIGGEISQPEYSSLISEWAGKFLAGKIDMKLIEKNKIEKALTKN